MAAPLSQGQPGASGSMLSGALPTCFPVPLVCRCCRSLLHIPGSVPSGGDSARYTRAGSFVASTLQPESPVRAGYTKSTTRRRQKRPWPQAAQVCWTWSSSLRCVTWKNLDPTAEQLVQQRYPRPAPPTRSSKILGLPSPTPCMEESQAMRSIAGVLRSGVSQAVMGLPQRTGEGADRLTLREGGAWGRSSGQPEAKTPRLAVSPRRVGA